MLFLNILSSFDQHRKIRLTSLYESQVSIIIDYNYSYIVVVGDYCDDWTI